MADATADDLKVLQCLDDVWRTFIELRQENNVIITPTKLQRLKRLGLVDYRREFGVGLPSLASGQGEWAITQNGDALLETEGLR